MEMERDGGRLKKGGNILAYWNQGNGEARTTNVRYSHGLHVADSNKKTKADKGWRVPLTGWFERTRRTNIRLQYFMKPNEKDDKIGFDAWDDFYNKLLEKHGQTKSLVTRLKEQFITLDTDGSGEIDFPEFKAHLGKIGVVIDEKEARKLFDVIDTNGSGEIDRKEFNEILRKNKKIIDKYPNEVPAQIMKNILESMIKNDDMKEDEHSDTNVDTSTNDV